MADIDINLIDAEYGNVVTLIQDIEAQPHRTSEDEQALTEAYSELNTLETLATEHGIYLQMPPWRIQQIKS